MTHGLPWVKNIKVMPLPPGKGREASRQKVSIHRPNKKWLNCTLLGSSVFKIYEQNFAFQKFFFSKNWSKLYRFHAFHPQSLRIMRNSLQNSSILAQCFQAPDHWQRTPRNWSELYRFCAFRPQFL